MTSEIYIIPVSNQNDNDKFIIFRPLLGMAFVGNRAMANLAQELLHDDSWAGPQNPAVTFMQSIGFLKPDPQSPDTMREEFAPSTAVLLLTNQCHLRCVYCYAAAGDSSRKMLTSELGHRAIDAVCQTAQERGRRQFEVSFHGGGEPIMAWHVLKDCVNWARKKTIPARITLTTNGIWSSQQCAWIIQNVNGLSLSMDGRPTTQDQHRPFSRGVGSSTIVLRSMAELDRYQYPYDVRMTAIAPWENLPRDVEFLCQRSDCRTIQVEPAFNTQRGGHNDPEPDDMRAFADAHMEAVEVAAKAGRRFYYSGARLGMVTTTFCTAPYNALIVTPDGDLTACYEVTNQTHPLASISRIGYIKDGQIALDQNARKHLHALMSERRDSCRDCFCYWSCAGGCYTRSFGLPPEGHLHNGNLCELHRRLTKSLLLKEIAQGNGVWHASMPEKRVAYVQK